MVQQTTALIGIYTLTPLHMGTGQATGAVDLPVARESHTGFPVIPATGIKGKARDGFEEAVDKTLVKKLFGPDLDSGSQGEDAAAGGLIFTEAQLVALPLRSLNLPIAWCTSRLVLERLVRNLATFGCANLVDLKEILPNLATDKVYVSRAMNDKVLVIEDMTFMEEEVISGREDVLALAGRLASLLPVPAAEDGTADRFRQSLVILPDQEFLRLCERGLPVQARIRLTKMKTNDNLWYEETVPPDTLFAAFVINRPGSKEDMVSTFTDRAGKKDPDLTVVQLGGNETVGQGWCWWQVRRAQAEQVKESLDLKEGGGAGRATERSAG
ncbi:type III-B CRISPR module RAMP protein Cmr4 [Thermodesulfobacteriota bacterium B35]